MTQKNNYKRKNNVNNKTYVYGNTVKQLSVSMPANPEKRHNLQDDEQEKIDRRKRRRELQRAHKINFFYTLAVIGVVTFIFCVCVEYLELQATVKNNASQVASLEKQLTELTDQNKMTELNINAQIDYDSILQMATGELGMVYPDKNQVVKYNSTESQYVKQFSDIPTKNTK